MCCNVRVSGAARRARSEYERASAAYSICLVCCNVYVSCAVTYVSLAQRGLRGANVSELLQHIGPRPALETEAAQHLCVCVCVCVCVCACVFVCARACVRVCVYAYMHASIHTYIQVRSAQVPFPPSTLTLTKDQAYLLQRMRHIRHST